MSQLQIRKTYADDTTPTQADFDNICDSLETFFNITKLASDNIGTITASTKFAAGAINGSKFVSAAVTANEIAAGVIGTNALAANAVTTIKIATSNVTTSKIVDNAVTTAKILDANVTADKIYLDAVTNAKIADGAVTAAKFATSAITQYKLVPMATSPATGQAKYSLISSFDVALTSTSANMDLSGHVRAHLSMPQGDGASSSATSYLYNYTGGSGAGFIGQSARFTINNQPAASSSKTDYFDVYYYSPTSNGMLYQMPTSSIKTLVTDTGSALVTYQTTSNGVIENIKVRSMEVC